ncbi:MAG: LysR family transcriptional regulator [Schwartzia sp.]|nr:LysR family transcriptional regulator [Schwartzia sp. (in: firmicutes)]
MEIKDMQAFYTVVEEGNISHAALRLAIAQPALSRQMKRLENSLGVQLFERGSRRIRLTEAGRLLYARVEHILGMVDGTVREISEIGTGVAGAIRIGTITSSGALVMPRLMSEFHRRWPMVTFEIWEGEGTRVLEMLDSHAIEIGITRSQVDSSLYESVVLANEPLVLMMNREKGVAGEDAETVRVAELKDCPIIVPLRWKAAFEGYCKQAGFTPNLVSVSDSVVLDVLSVRAGLGMAILPASAESLMDDDGALVVKRLTEPEILTHTVVSWLKNRTLSASAQHFVTLLKELYQEK